MVFECGPEGADGKVYRFLAQQLRSDLEIVPFFLDVKPRLTQESGSVTKQLMEIDGCERVMIIWDLRPAWPDERKKKRSLCPVEDCKRIWLSLKDKLTPQQLQCVCLLCVVQELETLLLVDHQALSQYLSKITKHPCNIRQIPFPERQPDPKGVLNRKFKESRFYRKYEDVIDAEKIIKLADINKLRRSPTFQKFEKRIREL